MTTRPGLVAWAAELGNADGVRRAVALGWDVDHEARIDVPSDQEWETGLHAAAGNGDEAMVRLLLELGADPEVTDSRFRSTPAQWAVHFGHDDLASSSATTLAEVLVVLERAPRPPPGPADRLERPHHDTVRRDHPGQDVVAVEIGGRQLGQDQVPLL